MKYAKIFGLLIITLILSLSVSSCTAKTMDLNPKNNLLNPVVDLKQNINSIVNNSTLSNSTIDTIDGQSFSYSEMLNYLLKLPQNQQPAYIKMDGSGSDPKTYRYSVSIYSDDNYHSVENNYVGIPLNNDHWKGSILYTKINNLATQFVINSDDKFNVTNWCIFQRDLRDTQYGKVDSQIVKMPEFPYTDEEIKAYTSFFGNPVETATRITIFCIGVNYWVNNVLKIMHKVLTQYLSDSLDVSLQNSIVAEARHEPNNMYWYPSIHPSFNYVDDNGLEIMNMYDQEIKSSLDKIRFALSTTLLILDDVVLAMDFIKAAIPSDYGMDKPMTFAILGVKTCIQEIKHINSEFIDGPYHTLDQETMKISSEKSYRALVKSGALKPRDPDSNEIAENNEFVNKQINNLINCTVTEYNRVHDPDYYTNLKGGYQDQLIYAQAKLDFYKNHNGDEKVIKAYEKLVVDLKNYIKDANDESNLQQLELSVWDDYSTRINKKLVVLKGRLL
jgi:hypothetical protein